MAQEIRSYNPNLTDQQAIVIARLNNIADDKGIISSTNNGKLYENIANLPKEYLKKYNVKREDINAATDYAKALIYVGQNSNSSSFTHELFHVVSYLRPEESKQLSNAIRHTLADEDRRSNLETFIDGHREIWQKAGDNSSTSQIMDRLSEIAENASKWRVGIEEDLARLWEAYQGSSTSIRNNMPKELRNLFEKLSRYIRQVYTTLKDNVALDSEIAKAYDQLMGIEESNKEQSPKNNTTSASIRNGEPESESKETSETASMLFQANRPSNFEEQLQDISKRDIGRPNDTIVFSTNTPEVFKKLGLADLSVEMFVNKLAKLLFLDNTKEHGHGDSIDKRIVSKLSKRLGDPIAVFDSSTVNNAIVALYDIESIDKKWIMVSILPDATKPDSLIVNMITSIYPKAYRTYGNWVENGKLRYFDNTKTKELTGRLQLPAANSLFTNPSVITKTGLVNKENVQEGIDVQESQTLNTQSGSDSKIKTQLSIAKEAVEELNLRFQKAPEGASITSSDGDTAIQKRNGTLVLSHSVNASRLKDIEAIGGMSMPSLAITKPELQSRLGIYGNITLIGDKDLAEKVIASGAVYDRDMWSPIVPEKAYKLNTAGLRGYFDELNDGMPTSDFGIPDMDRIPSYEAETARDLARYIGDRVAVYVAYAKEKGIEIPAFPTRRYKEFEYPEYLESRVQQFYRKKKARFVMNDAIAENLGEFKDFIKKAQPLSSAVLKERLS